MTASHLQCACGAVELHVSGEPQVQFFCHCGDCRAMTGGAYVAVALFSSAAVTLTRGETRGFTLRAMDRHRCTRCGAPVFANVSPEQVGMGATLLPKALFKPAFHIHCREAVASIRDELRHYAALPPEFGGSDERVAW